MKKPPTYSDENFQKKFESAELPTEQFTHRAHLRLTYLYINKYGVEEAIVKISDQLLNYVRKHNAESKFNATLTIAAVKTVNHFLKKSVARSFEDFIMEFPQLEKNFKGLINQHYTIDVFNSEFAKKEFIEPDLLPYD